MKIKIKVGPNYTNRGKFDQSDNPATRIAAMKLAFLSQAKAKARPIIKEKVVERLAEVQDQIRNDIDIYASQMLRFFFKQKSNQGDKDLRIQMSSFDSGNPFKSAYTGVGIANKDVTLEWPALSPKTIKAKQGNRTYFIHSGKLQETLQAKFAPFLQSVLVPTIVFKEEAEGEDKVGTIQITMLASKKGQNLQNLPFLKPDKQDLGVNDLIGLTGKDFSLIDKFLGDQVAYKLTNAAHKDKNRQFVSPVIAYWVLSRFPSVVAQSMKQHFKAGI